MSDLMLNTFSAPAEEGKKVKKEKEVLTRKDQKNSVQRNNNFSFNFTSDAKIQAVVARKRPGKIEHEPEVKNEVDGSKSKRKAMPKAEVELVVGHSAQPNENVEFPDHVPGQFAMNPNRKQALEQKQRVLPVKNNAKAQNNPQTETKKNAAHQKKQTPQLTAVSKPVKPNPSVPRPIKDEPLIINTTTESEITSKNQNQKGSSDKNNLKALNKNLQKETKKNGAHLKQKVEPPKEVEPLIINPTMELESTSKKKNKKANNKDSETKKTPAHQKQPKSTGKKQQKEESPAVSKPSKPNPSAPRPTEEEEEEEEPLIINTTETTEPIESESRKKDSKASDLNEFKFFEKQMKPLVTQAVVNPIVEDVFSGKSFESSGIHPHSAKNIKDILGFKELTSVQHKTVPIVLAGHDVLVKSQTGSGKTLAYALPVVESLHQIRPKLSRKEGILALVIVPTRELAVQTYELFLKLLKPFTWLVPGYLCGGEKRKSEKARLRNGINILVVTPGRMCDHLEHTESMRLDKVKFLVLDEADRLLELGYENDVRKIVDSLNAHKTGKPTEVKDTKDDSAFESEEENPMVKKSVQSLLLSATLTPLVKKLAGLTLKDPKFIETTVNENANLESMMEDNENEIENISIPACVTQKYLICPVKMRLVTLSGLVANECGVKRQKVLVFFATQDLVDYHYDVMVEVLAIKASSDDEEEESEIDEDADVEHYQNKGHERVTEDGICVNVRFFKLHGSMSQVERSSIFKEFRAVKAGVLFCTDVAGRGVDFPEIDMIVQYTPPQKLFDYVHRVGRTGRAGRKGTAVIFLTPYEQEYVNLLETNRIQISADDVDFYLRGLLPADNKYAKLQDTIYQYQNKYENLLKGDKEIHERACKAFMSWIRFYTTFPKNMREYFNLKQAHMGHYAKSLGLQEPPSQFAKKHSAPREAKPINRLTNKDQKVSKWKTAREPNKWGEGGKRKWDEGNIGSLTDAARKSIVLNISEFGSGLSNPKPSKKRKVE